jgi:hypothetical protein
VNDRADGDVVETRQGESGLHLDQRPSPGIPVVLDQKSAAKSATPDVVNVLRTLYRASRQKKRAHIYLHSMIAGMVPVGC